MILADTSVWIDHFRHGRSRLGQLLLDGEVVSHPFVIGEVACGSLTNRGEILILLETLPKVVIADHLEVLRLVDTKRLYGRGLGWIDMHLLASARLGRQSLWSADRRLRETATRLGLTDAE